MGAGLMFALDIAKMRELHAKYGFSGPLLDAGGVINPTIADYEISAAKAIEVTVTDDTGKSMVHRVPHSVQGDRYVNQVRPWSFIDPNYLILNPDDRQLPIEDLPAEYPERFATVILVSVFEHVDDPYEVSDALFEILKPGGWLLNSTPFLFPYHPAPEDNWRFAPLTLKRIHERSGFVCVESDFHVNYSSKAGIGDSNPTNYGAPQAIMASYALCRKPQ